MKNKVALIILDGWGIGNKDKTDAVFNSKTPFFKSILDTNINSKLRTDGNFVGLPIGQMGNSEVGHLNIGSGRVVFQELVKINKSISDESFFTNKQIQAILNYSSKNPNAKIHIMGLVSDGGIHSHINHLKATITAFKNLNNSVLIHGFSDGRDTAPKGGINYFKDLENYIKDINNTEIASIIGRYFAMDRDNRWERIAEAYHLLVNNKGKQFNNSDEVFNYHYTNNITDEFIKASKIKTSFSDTSINKDDIVLCFNYRTDRCREISIVLSQENKEEFNMKKLDIEYYTMTNYDENFKNVQVIFPKQNLKNTLGEVLSKNNKTQLRIAETEKYPHVTFFFSGGQESEFKGETRIMIPSPKVATYDLAPEMSAEKIKDATINHIHSDKASDFICLNFANPDMVGHTGDFNAVTKAVETVDNCISELIPALIKEDYQIVVIADHGNAELMINPDNSIHTAHTTNPVPCILINSEYKKLKDGKLADLAPTILNLMKIEKPKEMDGECLV